MAVQALAERTRDAIPDVGLAVGQRRRAASALPKATRCRAVATRFGFAAATSYRYATRTDRVGRPTAPAPARADHPAAIHRR